MSDLQAWNALEHLRASHSDPGETATTEHASMARMVFS
jgi:hypothetical protein